MKYFLESELAKYLKNEIRLSKRKRPFVFNLYTTNTLANGEKILPVFDSVDEILAWEAPQNEFEKEAYETLISLCAKYASIDEERLTKMLKDPGLFDFAEFDKNLQTAISSLKFFLGSRIQENTRSTMLENAEQISLDDALMIRTPNEDENVNDSILYFVSNENVAEEIIQELSDDKNLNPTGKLYILSSAKKQYGE